MKKSVSVLLSFLLILSSLVFPVFASDDGDDICFTVASDIHSDDEGEISVRYPESELYFHARNTGNLYWEAEGILATFLADSAAKGVSFVLIPGDLADNGTKEQHERIAAILAAFENESGIPVYVVPGNHDYKHTTVGEFRAYYDAFGYGEALASDIGTASYTADLPGNYRLIAVDSNNPGKDGDGITDELLAWIEEQAGAAKADGRTVIYMMHHTLLDPIPYAKLLMKDFIVRDSSSIAEKFTRIGIRYVFSGHEHGNNITSYKGINGETVYDVVTTALSSYPLEYRLVTCSGSKMKIETVGVTEYNPDYLRDGYTEAQLSLMEEDYTAYAYGYFKYSIEKKIGSFITAEFIKDKLNAEEGVLADAVDTVMPLVEEALTMPLYGEPEKTVESIAKKYGVSLPGSEYETLYDLATTLVASVYSGEENMSPENSPEEQLLVRGLNVMLTYIISQVGIYTVKTALIAILDSVGLPGSMQEFIYRFVIIPNAERRYFVAEKSLYVLLKGFFEDDSIPDRNCELELIKTGETASPTGLAAFFTRIFELFERLFSIFSCADAA